MSNSTEKFDVSIEYLPDYGKEWVVVRFRNGNKWIPSLEDLHRIVAPICECEDKKYPPPAGGRWTVLNFLIGVVKGKSYEDLAKEFKLPIRDGNKTINTNGAKV